MDKVYLRMLNFAKCIIIEKVGVKAQKGRMGRKLTLRRRD